MQMQSINKLKEKRFEKAFTWRILYIDLLNGSLQQIFNLLCAFRLLFKPFTGLHKVNKKNIYTIFIVVASLSGIFCHFHHLAFTQIIFQLINIFNMVSQAFCKEADLFRLLFFMEQNLNPIFLSYFPGFISKGFILNNLLKLRLRQLFVCDMQFYVSSSLFYSFSLLNVGDSMVNSGFGALTNCLSFEFIQHPIIKQFLIFDQPNIVVDQKLILSLLSLTLAHFLKVFLFLGQEA